MPELRLDNKQFASIVKALFKYGYSLRFRARGLSMRPFINDGDILEVETIGTNPIRRGEVLLCQLGDGKILAHRLLRINSHNDGQILLYLKGDSQLSPGDLVSEDQIMGRVVMLERGG